MIQTKTEPHGGPLRILLLEDVARDAEIIQLELRTIGVPFTTNVLKLFEALFEGL